MKISIYLSDEEVSRIELSKLEGESIPQAVKRLALGNTGNNQPTTEKEHLTRLAQTTKWLIDNYKERSNVG